MRSLTLGFAALLLAVAAQATDSQANRFAPELTYADLADLALAAPVVAHLQVRRARPLRAEQAPGVPPGHRRFLVDAELIGLIRGAGGLPPRVRYLVDLPQEERGEPARLRRKSQHLVFAAPVPGESNELRLIARDAQVPYTPAAADRLRSILMESVRPEAPPRIAGVGRAFHVPGALPGESETQVFLVTEERRPISLNILRRPDRRPQWSVALGEMVGSGAEPPARATLLWYRLACFLPRSLPPASLRDAAPDEVSAIEADYRLVMSDLGPCPRNRPQA